MHIFRTPFPMNSYGGLILKYLDISKTLCKYVQFRNYVEIRNLGGGITKVNINKHEKLSTLLLLLVPNKYQTLS